MPRRHRILDGENSLAVARPLCGKLGCANLLAEEARMPGRAKTDARVVSTLQHDVFCIIVSV